MTLHKGKTVAMIGALVGASALASYEAVQVNAAQDKLRHDFSAALACEESLANNAACRPEAFAQIKPYHAQSTELNDELFLSMYGAMGGLFIGGALGRELLKQAGEEKKSKKVALVKIAKPL